MTISKPKFTLSAGKALTAEFEQSGLKPGAFCAKKNIPYHLLKYWRDQCNGLNAATKQPASKFVPVKIINNTDIAEPIKIILNQRLCIEVPNGANLTHLKQILEVCKSCG